ncbi:MAG TPA: CDGSH iron-sulfur domain-containing protein [Prolixibacteraceae bacterium]|nr:CDGSH iron-sulfur domain-containing protein [Prolixibacteraceae bacterium]
MEKPAIASKSPVAMELEPGTYYWCACGKSSRQPFCDGSHRGSSFVPLPFEVSEKKKVFLCRCKHSNTKPYCDGSHRDL